MKLGLKEVMLHGYGIKISGTNVIVNMVMAVEKPKILDDTEVCNIVSDKEAIISKISVQNGTARVNARRCCKTRRFTG